jgi:hypothetical protein
MSIVNILYCLSGFSVGIGSAVVLVNNIPAAFVTRGDTQIDLYGNGQIVMDGKLQKGVLYINPVNGLTSVR